MWTQTSTFLCTVNIKHCENVLPNKAARSSADDGPIPQFVATVTSLHSGTFAGFFTLRPRLFRHKSAHCVSRWWRHTFVISGHHRKRSRSSNEKNNPHALAEIWREVHPRFLRVDSKRRSNSVGNCIREATFTHALHAPCSPVECFYDTGFKTSRLWMRFYGRGTPSRGFLWFGSIKTCSCCWF